VFVPPGGVLHGKDGVRQGFETLLSDLPDAEWAVPTHIFRDDVLFIEWGAASEMTWPLVRYDIGQSLRNAFDGPRATRTFGRPGLELRSEYDVSTGRSTPRPGGPLLRPA
jgi:hypothetical protein